MPTKKKAKRTKLGLELERAVLRDDWIRSALHDDSLWK